MMDVWMYGGSMDSQFVMARERRLCNDPVAACSRGPDGAGGKDTVDGWMFLPFLGSVVWLSIWTSAMRLARCRLLRKVGVWLIGLPWTYHMLSEVGVVSVVFFARLSIPSSHSFSIRPSPLPTFCSS